MQPKQQPNGQNQPLEDDEPIQLTPGSTIHPGSAGFPDGQMRPAAPAQTEITVQLSHVLRDSVEPDPIAYGQGGVGADQPSTEPGPNQSDSDQSWKPVEPEIAPAAVATRVSADKTQSAQSVPLQDETSGPDGAGVAADTQPQPVPVQMPPDPVSDLPSQAGQENSDDMVTAPNSEVGQAPQPREDVQAPVAPVPPTTTAQTRPPHRKPRRRKIWGVLILVLLALIGGATYYYVAYMKADDTQGEYTFATDPAPAEKKAAQLNSWTGEAGSMKWSDEKNWSLGKPENGQNLEIDVSKVDRKDGKATVEEMTFQNDVKDLYLNKLTFKGEVSTVSTGIKGQGFAVAEGIEDSIKRTDDKAEVPRVQVSVPVTFAKDQTVRVSGQNVLAFIGSGTIFSTGETKVSFIADDASTLTVNGAIKGSGWLIFPDRESVGGALTFDGSSSGFTGGVTIGSGNQVRLGKGPGGAVMPADRPAAFGTAKIEVKSGGSLSLISSGAEDMMLGNDLTLAGSGVAASGAVLGAQSGALNACVDKAQKGCSIGVTVLLTGKVKLAANTTLGASFGADKPGKPTSTTTTYTIPSLEKAEFTLAAVEGSRAVIR